MDNLSYNVLYSADDDFAETLGVSICSLFENNQDAHSINIKILDSGISELNRTRINSICHRYNRMSPTYVKPINIEEKVGHSLRTDRGSLAQFSRLYLANLYPKEVTRVLYLDCDTVIQRSIHSLWKTDLEGNIIAALKDAFSSYYRRNIGLKEKDIMFNSGVMLIDLNAWRLYKVEDKLTNFIKEKKGSVQQGDQGALNAILSKHTKVLEPRYNMVSIFYDLTYKEIAIYRKPVDFYTEKEINDSKKKPVIVHFTSSFYNRRPWMNNSNHKMSGVWLDYRNKTPWSSESLRNIRKGKKVVSVIFNILPRDLALRIAGFFQIYVRPIKNMIFGG